jgi:hypothetical protein
MPTISLTSFLKILTKGTPQKVQEYKRYLAPGGYDFYWRLKEATHACTVGGEVLGDCLKSIEECSNPVERKHNIAGLKSLKKYLDKYQITEFFDAPAGSYSSPLGLVTIKLEPEVGAVVNNQHRAIQIWNSSGSNLSRTVAGVGIYLLGRLCQGDFAHCKPGILDVRKRELYLSDALPPNIEPIVTSELAWLDGFFQAHSKAA